MKGETLKGEKLYNKSQMKRLIMCRFRYNKSIPRTVKATIKC